MCDIHTQTNKQKDNKYTHTNKHTGKNSYTYTDTLMNANIDTNTYIHKQKQTQTFAGYFAFRQAHKGYCCDLLFDQHVYKINAFRKKGHKERKEERKREKKK